MGAVYRVRSALSVRVAAALKVMKPSGEPDARARFVVEAEALAALRHRAIVRILGFSEDADRGFLYLVMELAVGETLKRRLERGSLGLAEALGIFVPLSSGLEHAHAAGIFHRDLKPSNVVLAADGVRLVDFGIAAVSHAETFADGRGQLGTLSYLPPEVFRGERAEPRGVDVYAFGLLLYEALTGLQPFPVEAGQIPAAATAIVAMRKLQHPAMDPGEAAPAVIRDLVRRATDPDPRARPDMAEIRDVLATLVERRAGGSVAAGNAIPRVQPWTPSADETAWVADPLMPPGGTRYGAGTSSRTRRSWRGRRRSGIATWVVGLLAAALVAALIVTMLRGVSGVSNRSASEASPAPAAMPETPEPAGTQSSGDKTAPDAADVTGEWTLVNRIDATDHAPYEGMHLGYRLTLRQEGDRITGEGEKVSEDGVLLPAGQRSPIVVTGRIENRSLTLDFTERGAVRSSSGTFRWWLSADQARMSGTFTSDAAASHGASSVRRAR